MFLLPSIIFFYKPWYTTIEKFVISRINNNDNNNNNVNRWVVKCKDSKTNVNSDNLSEMSKQTNRNIFTIYSI